jgi:hypothetical protein
MQHDNAAASGLWYPPQQPGFGPWIEWSGGESPVSGRSKVAWILSHERAARRYSHMERRAEHLVWGIIGAYCVALEDQPAATACAATQSSDWRDWHEGDTVPACDRVDVVRKSYGLRGASDESVDNVPTTSIYWGPNSFVIRWRPAAPVTPVADPNAAMVQKDAAKPGSVLDIINRVAGAFGRLSIGYSPCIGGSLDADGVRTAWRDGRLFTYASDEEQKRRGLLVTRQPDHRCGLWPKE